jgi:alkanesulfonate monooxygenase SsuD/methylene tetrahydromethanopterin reductase-like flavin-dependent oxidoreductase (luciferase family)
MKIGYACNPGSSELTGPYRDIVNNVREIADHCDRTGFDSIWFTEHHFGYYKRANLPNPVMMGADIAARTRRIRIGLASATIPLWHPIRLAEDLALLDQFSDGRLELGVGRGNHGVEALNLNPSADPRSPEDNYAVFAETLEILKRAFSQPTFRFEGEKYTFPTPGFTWDRAHTVEDPDYVDPESGEVTKLSVIPRTIQQPYPPLWQMVDSTRSIDFAAANDLGIIMWRPPVTSLKVHFDHYRERAAEAGRTVAPGEGAGVMRDMFVADSMEEAARLAGDYVMRNLNWSNWRGPSIYLEPGETLAPEQEAELKQTLPFEWVAPRSLLFGTPEAVADQLIELRDTLNIDTVLVTSDWKGMPHELTMKSLRLFSERVLPRIGR